MTEKDVMVGDWFRFRYATISNREVIHTFRISQIENQLGQYYVWGDGFGRMCHPENLEPIPLTAEILEKNGFKNVSVITVGIAKMRWVSEDTRTEITIWMDDTMPMEIVKNVYYEDEVSYTLPFPGCVHELQHALRLCGISKDITL